MLLDILLLALALAPLVPLTRFRWSERAVRGEAVVPLERCLFMECDDEDGIAGLPAELEGRLPRTAAQEPLTLHPQHS